MSDQKRKGGKVMFALACIGVFLLAAGAGAAGKLLIQPGWAKDYVVEWSDAVGTVQPDIPYGGGEAQKFDLYLPADGTRDSYGLVVYLHAGGFTGGDKTDDADMLQWLCSRGYVAAGINYTLFSEDHPDANVYTQSMEIRDAMTQVVAAADEAGYHVDKMAVAGGSAGGCLALLYAYRDADAWPVPVAMVFEAVGPSCFYPEDWDGYGFDQRTAETDAAAATLFSVMSGKEITPDMFGTPAYDEAMRDISALLWVDEGTVPTLMCYGKHDRIQGFGGSVRLDAALTEAGVPHDYVVLEHSGHGLQNDSAELHRYYQLIERYLDTYLPVG